MLRKAVLLTLAVFAVSTADAGATLRVTSANDPAGDPTAIHYRISSPTWSASPIDFQLVDGDYRSFGVAAGTYTIEAFPPAGWYVGDIQCDPPGTSAFAIDVAHARVVVTHAAIDHHFCTFTNRKGTPGSAPSPGIAPAPPRSLVPSSLLSRHPALVGVRAGHGYAEASIRITQKSVIKGWLLRHKKFKVGFKRIKRNPGTHVLRVKLKEKRMRRMQRRGLDHVKVLLRVAVIAPNGATHVFKHRVLIDL